MNWKYWLCFFLSCSGYIQGQTPFNLDAYDGEVTMDFDASSDFILLEVKFNNVLPLKFIFDTGSEHTILFKKEYADLLGVQYDKRIPLMGSDMSQEIYGYIARGIPLNLDNEYQVRTDILVLQEDYLKLEEFTGVSIDGIIGSSIFRNFVVGINNRKDRLTFYELNEFRPPKRYKSINLEIDRHKPYILAEAELAGELIPLTLLLDTGAGLPVLLYTNTSNQLHLPDNTIQGSLGMGLGGNLTGYVGRLDAFRFGNYEYGSLVTSFQDINLGKDTIIDLNRNGILGNSLLSRFNYYIDYFNETMHIKPRRRFKRKFKYDKSGLVIVATGRHLRDFIVQRIIPDSPAEEAGFHRGDVIRRIEGFPAQLKTLSAINSILSSREGRRITIVIERKEERIKKKFRLRKII